MAIRSVFGAIQERNVRLVVLGQGVSALGDRMVPIALAFAVLGLTDSPSDLGYVLGGQTIATLALVLFGGVFGDRLSRRTVMVTCDVSRAAVQMATAVLLLTETAEVWELVVLAAMYGAATAFAMPATTGLLPATVAPERLHQANALFRLSRSTATIAGPAFAGVLLAIGSPGFVLAVDALTFLVSAGCLVRLRLVEEPDVDPCAAPASVFRDLAAGWQAIRSRSWLLLSIVYFGLFNLAATPAFFVLGPYVARHSLGGSTAWATILAAGGVGSVAGGLVALRWQPARPLAAALGAMFLWWPPIALLAITAPTFVVAGAFLLASAGAAFATILWLTILQQGVPQTLISRVSSFDWLGTLALTPAGFLLVGWVAARTGVAATLTGAAVLSALATALVVTAPSVRGVSAPAPA